MWRKLNISILPGWICRLAIGSAVLLAACSPKQPAGVTGSPTTDAMATTVAASVGQATVGAIATQITKQTSVAKATEVAKATLVALSTTTDEASSLAATTTAAAAQAAPSVDPVTEAPTNLAATTLTADETPLPDIAGAQATPNPSGAGIPAVLQGLDTQLGWGSSPNQDWFWAYDQGEVVGALTEVRPLVIRSADGQKEWRVKLAEEDLYGNQYIDAYYVPFFWLPAEPYVYLVSSGYGDDRGAVFSRNQNLVRLNLSTGKLEPQVVGAERHYYRFSTNGAYYLDAPQGTPLVRIHHLVNGQEMRVELHSTWTHSGNALFSLDNKQVVVQSWEVLKSCQSSLCQRSPLILINVETGEYRVLLADMLQSLGQPQMVLPNFTWLDASHLQISIGSPQMGYSQWSLDIRDNALTQLQDALPK